MSKQYTIDDLIKIIETLRGENGCPWDRAQTHESIKKDLIEEAYEAVEALNSGSDAAFANELGDVLLQVVFHSQLAKERGAFDFNVCLNEICGKLISRHTHVFGEDKAVSVEESLDVWEKNKKTEKGLKTAADVLKDVPRFFPALMRAEKVQKKASKVGFDWSEISGVFDKIREETAETAEAVSEQNQEHMEEELGDLLFSVVNAARFMGVNPETALTKATDKFIGRFEKMEREAAKSGKSIDKMSADELDAIWVRIK